VSVSLYTGGGVLVTSTTTANNATTGLAGY
jgi:hypothetical protein